MRQLVELEFFALFAQTLEFDQRHLYSDTLIDITNSAFVSSVIEIMTINDTLDEVRHSLPNIFPAHVDDFCLRKISLGFYPDVLREELFTLFPALSHVTGEINITNPTTIFILTRDKEGKWIFGLQKSAQDGKYLEHKNKPQNFSSAISSHFACTFVSSLKQAGPKLLDACCGTGTVLLEACHAGLTPTGLDTSYQSRNMSRINIAHYGYTAEVLKEDAALHQGQYDSAVIDFPYGSCCPRDIENEKAIIRNLADKVKQAIFITADEQKPLFLEEGYTVAWSVIMKFKKLDRYIYYVYGRK